MQQHEMICLEDLVPENHNYRKFVKIWSFKLVEKRLKKIEKENPNKGRYCQIKSSQLHFILKIFKR